MVFKENTGQKIDMINMVFKLISKKQILQRLKAFGNVFFNYYFRKTDFWQEKILWSKYRTFYQKLTFVFRATNPKFHFQFPMFLFRDIVQNCIIRKH